MKMCLIFQSIKTLLINLKQLKKALKRKISGELMPIARNCKRWSNFCVSEDEKKKTEQFFTK